MAMPLREDRSGSTTQAEMSDHALYAAIAQGSSDGVLWKRFINHFSRLCYHAIHRVFVKYSYMTPLDVDETFQRLFVHLLENDRAMLKRFRGENGCTEATYLAHLAAYEALEYARSREQRGRYREASDVTLEGLNTLDGPTFASHDDAADVSMIKAHEASQVQACVERLNPTDRLLYTLHYVDGLTLAEIARVLARSEAAVHTQHFRLKDRIRKFMAELVESPGMPPPAPAEPHAPHS